MEPNVRTYARRFARNCGTEYECPFGNCNHASFGSEDEMTRHLLKIEVAGGHKSEMRRQYNEILIRAQAIEPAISCISRESIEQTEEDSGNSVGMPEGDHPGNSVGMAEGDVPGNSVGMAEGDVPDNSVGMAEGDHPGISVGMAEGDHPGNSAGMAEGNDPGNSVGRAEGDHRGNSVSMPDGNNSSWSSTHRKREARAMKLVWPKEESFKRSRYSKKDVKEPTIVSHMEPKPKLAEPIESLVSSDPTGMSGGDDPPHRNCKATYVEKGKDVALEMELTPNVPAANERLVKYVPPTEEKVSSNPVGIFGGDNPPHSSAHKDCKASHAEKGKALEIEPTLNVLAGDERLVEYVPPTVEKIPCAACKILRRQCTDNCVLAPYFPLNELEKFAIADRVFGASKIIKVLQELPESQRADAVSSIVYEADARIRDPVYGCTGAVCHLQNQVNELQAQLAMAQAKLVTMQCQQANLLSLVCMEMTQSKEPSMQQETCETPSSSLIDENIIWEPLWT